MGNIEAIGDAITGTMVGRAVEPNAGEAADGHTHETSCLNCGTALSGPYCYECGQHAHVHRTLSSFFHDFAHGVLHFEGKIFRTLPMLAWRPGELTRRYIDGQRARFVSPIALFLFCVFITFAVMGLAGNMLGEIPAAAKQDMAGDLAKDQQKIAKLSAKRDIRLKAGKSTANVDDQLASLRTEAAALQAIHDGKAPPNLVQFDEGDKLPGWARDIIGNATKNPELLFYKLKTNAYKYSWALIPISVPFVWLLFPFSRRFRLYDHTVFVTYSLCFMMLLLVVATLVGLVSETIASLAWFLPPVHMYRQLRGTYGCGVAGALLRTMALTIFAFIAIGLFASLLVGLGGLH
jgi:hypothetical protein